MIPEPQKTYLLELLTTLGPASDEFVLVGGQALKFVLGKARPTRDFDFLLDAIALREKPANLATKLESLNYKVVPGSRNFQFEKPIPETTEVMRIEFMAPREHKRANDFRVDIENGLHARECLGGTIVLHESDIHELRGVLPDGTVAHARLRATRAHALVFLKTLALDDRHKNLRGPDHAEHDRNEARIHASDTGKELIARAIHDLSPRCGCPFVKLNCAAIPFDLLESELFGHEKGAFTGAVAQRVGRFEEADTGTLFLDEVGDLPLSLQPKLLRVLQEQEFERLGSGRTHRINVRLIAATHRDLAQLVARNSFRSDLYYRVNIFPILMPPLRDRRDDIPQLVLHFVEGFSRRMGKRIQHIPESTMSAFSAYDWPGNVRELQNMVERAVIRSDNEVLLNPFPTAPSPTGSPLKREGELRTTEQSGGRARNSAIPKTVSTDSLEDLKRRHILRVLERTSWVISGPSGAAAILNLHPNTLRSLMDRLGITQGSGGPQRSMVPALQ